MKSLIVGTLAVAVLTLGGCSLNRSEVGGEVSSPDSNFRMSAPLMETSVRQGEVRTVTVSLNRGRSFTQDVNLTIEEPRGLSIEPNDITVRSSDRQDVQLVITADEDAPIAVHQVEVQAEPETGKTTWVQFPVRVTAR